MTLIEWILVILFVIPIIVACVAFLLAALWMQVKEEVKGGVQVAELHT